MKEQDSAQARPKRRLRTWLLGGLGLAFLAVAAAPTLLAPAVVRAVVAGVDEDLPGRVSVADVSVGWLTETRLDGCVLADPTGAEVARCDVTAPSLLSLAKGLGRDLGTVRVRARASLVADESGETNLARALGTPPPDGDAPGADGDGSTPDELPRGRVEFELERVSWSDPTTRASGVDLGLENVAGALVLEGGSSMTFDLEGEVLGADGGRLDVDVAVRDALAGFDSDTPPSFRAKVRASGLATGLVDALANGEGRVRELLGPTLAFDLDAEGTTRAGAATARLTSSGLAGTFVAEVVDGVLRARGEEPVLEAELRAVPRALALAAASLPEGASVAAPDAEAPAVLTVRGLDLPLEVLLSEESASEGEASGGLDSEEEAELAPRLLASLSAVVEATFPDLRYVHPTEAGGSVPVELSNLRVQATLAAGAPLTGRCTADVGGGQRGSLAADFRHPEPARALAEPPVPAPFEARLTSFPTALVDALAEQDGLLVDALGPRIDGEVAGVWPLEAEPVAADFRSASGTFRVTARLAEGVLTAGEGGLVDARVGLSPLVSQRIVGNLVPHLVQLEHQDANERVALSVSDFSLPLDGDLSKLSATVALDLGAVRYKLLPGLDELLALAGKGPATRAQRLERFTLRVADGRVAYEDLPLSIDGVAYPLAGSFDLGERAFDLETELPLSLLGKKVTGELGRASALLGADTLVPLELKGTWSKPRLSVPGDFVQRVLEGAGSDLLERGLRGILGGN